MKKLLFILLCFALVSSSCLNLEKNHIVKYHVDDDVVLGVWDDTYRLKTDSLLMNGVLYCDSGIMGNIVDGKRDGSYKEWEWNGNLRVEGNYNKGSLQGYFKYWWKNGNIKSEGNYHNGKRWDGLHRSWYENGQLSSERYYKDGLAHGLAKGWDVEGDLWQEIHFFRGNERLNYILMRKLQPIIAEYYINQALKEGYKLSIENDKFLCECTYNKDRDWIDNKTNDYCSHDLARTSLYFPENRKIKLKDINNDNIDDYIINYTIEGFGGGNMYANYNGAILGGEKLNYVQTEVYPKYWTEYIPTDHFKYALVEKMGICRDVEDSIYNGLSDEFRALLPVCDRGDFYIYHYPPNYYAVYLSHAEWCGLAGCAIHLYKKEEDNFIQISNIWGDLILNECTSDYLTVSETIKFPSCWYHSKKRLIVKDDNFDIIKASLEHTINNEEFHDENCINNKLLASYK